MSFSYVGFDFGSIGAQGVMLYRTGCHVFADALFLWAYVYDFTWLCLMVMHVFIH